MSIAIDKRMKNQEIKSDVTPLGYLSKRVLVNGQFVTLYSANGQTWLSSPEEIPELMARLDNTRITLATGEKGEGGDVAVAKPEATDATKPDPNAAAKLNTRYRMKGPKPRPVLRQNGVIITGTPIEPISASNTMMRFSEDVVEEPKAKSSARRDSSGSTHKSSTKGTKQPKSGPVAKPSPKVAVRKGAERIEPETRKAKVIGAKKVTPVKTSDKKGEGKASGASKVTTAKRVAAHPVKKTAMKRPSHKDSTTSKGKRPGASRAGSPRRK